MGKLIAVCGMPVCGKTVIAVKLAQELHGISGKPVVYLSPDVNTPALAYIFPDEKDEDLFSLGAALDKTDIYKEDVLKQTVTSKKRGDVGYIGFKLGENKYSYPKPTEDKVEQLFSALADLAEYAVIDCTCDEDDIISTLAKRDCDKALRIYTPDIRGIVYNESCVNKFLTVKDKSVKVMNITDKDIYLPVKETEKRYGGMDIILPYERMLKQQMITGTLARGLGGCAFKAEMEKTAKAVI
ncbi:MAG: hypothetical protein IJS94_01210 [Clostridia bacterium]|nr:hypothetical protein [Clostridia bacterium]